MHLQTGDQKVGLAVRTNLTVTHQYKLTKISTYHYSLFSGDVDRTKGIHIKEVPWSYDRY